MEEGGDQQGVGKKAKLIPPTADGVVNSSPNAMIAAKRKHDGDEGEESSPAKKRRLTSDSMMVGQSYTHHSWHCVHIVYS